MEQWLIAKSGVGISKRARPELIAMCQDFAIRKV
jgi:hypothetical protein